MPSFPDLAALNDWLEQRCALLWHEIPHAVLPGSVAEVTSGFATAGCRSCELTPARHRRWSSTPTTRPLPSSAELALGGFMTVRLGRHGSEARPNEDGSGYDLRRSRPRLQPQVPADVRALPGRSRRLHTGIGLGEGTGREPGRRCQTAVLRASAQVQELRRTQRLARGSLRCLGQVPSAPGASGSNDLGSIPRRARELGALRRPVRRLPCRAGVGLEDLPRPLRQ